INTRVPKLDLKEYTRYNPTHEFGGTLIPLPLALLITFPLLFFIVEVNLLRKHVHVPTAKEALPAPADGDFSIMHAHEIYAQKIDVLFQDVRAHTLSKGVRCMFHKKL
ncbi:hypothetical protein ACJX0J_022304, partial [Zea mays]